MADSKQLSIGERVIISDLHHWAKGCGGIIKQPPDAVKLLDENWNGCRKTVFSIKGETTAYWVEFDKAQFDADGDGPYAAGAINSEYLN